jgi:hypothetical protein
MRRLDHQPHVGLVASLVAVAALGLTTAFTLGGFSGAITNNFSTFTSAIIQLEQSNGSATCYSTGTGSGGTVTVSDTNFTCTINALVGTPDQVPGGNALTTIVTFINTGNHSATIASLVAGSCTAAAASDANGYVGAGLTGNAFCGKVDVTIANTTSGATDKCVFPTQAATCPALSNTNTLATLAGSTFNAVPMSTIAAGVTATYSVSVQLDSSATSADQSLTATVPLTWSIAQ